METAQNNNQTPEPKKKGILKNALKIIGLLLILINIGYLDYSMISEKILNKKEEIPEIIQDYDALDLQSKLDILSKEIEEIKSATLSAHDEEIAKDEQEVKVIEKETVVEKIVQEKATVKEYYIPLGGASFKTEKFEWQDTGAEALVDLSKYGNIESVVFEASLSVPAGQAEARLYNVTDGHEIGGSRIIGDGATPKLYRTGNLSLSSQAKTYRVQVRTSLYYISLMDDARLKLTVK